MRRLDNIDTKLLQSPGHQRALLEQCIGSDRHGQRLQQLGVDVVEAPHDRIGTRLIDTYLSIKRKGAIG